MSVQNATLLEIGILALDAGRWKGCECSEVW